MDLRHVLGYPVPLTLVVAVCLTAAADAREWTAVVLHHTATETGSVASIDAAHRQRRDADGKPWLGIGYHFLIGNGNGMPDGAVEPTFRWDRQLAGAHAGDSAMNQHAIGVALVGNFESRPPTARQTEALVALLKTLATEHGLGPGDLIAHADVRPTLCPGRHFPLAAIRDAVASGETTESPR